MSGYKTTIKFFVLKPVRPNDIRKAGVNLIYCGLTVIKCANNLVIILSPAH